MYPYLGDFPTGETIYLPFHTFDSNDPSASVTLTGLATTDIEVYKDGSVTQRSSDSGFALLDTDGIDFDGITGIHGISIDTSDNTDAGFWAAGSDYWVVISSITVDAATINFVLATFSIDNRGLLRPTTAQRTLDVTATGAAGIDWGNIENTGTTVDLSATTIDSCDDVTGAVGSVTGAVGSISGVTFPTNFADLSITATTGRVDVGSWIGTAVTLGNGLPDVNVDSWNDTTVTAIETASDVRSIASGTADSGTTTTLVDAARTEADTDYWKGALLLITSGTISGQVRQITGFNPATDTITVDRAFTQAVGTNTYEILATGYVDTTVVDGIQADLDNGTDGLGAIKADTAAILVDTNELQTDDVPGLIAALNDVSAADVNAQMVDVLSTDTQSLPGQGAPSATPTLATAIMYLYKNWRNRKTQDSTTWELYDDAGTTVDQKATVSDDGTDAEKSEIVSGP